MSVFFSIIIPTYNRREKLQRCLDALVHQTYKNFEVIICDDGSTDGTDAPSQMVPVANTNEQRVARVNVHLLICRSNHSTLDTYGNGA